MNEGLLADAQEIGHLLLIELWFEAPSLQVVADRQERPAESLDPRGLSVTRSPGKKATRPCPCYLADGTDRCRCSLSKLERYRDRISGPLLDRLDLHVEVPRVSFADVSEPMAGDESSVLRNVVELARARQLERSGRLDARLDASAQSRKDDRRSGSSDGLTTEHVAEALQLRCRDRSP